MFFGSSLCVWVQTLLCCTARVLSAAPVDRGWGQFSTVGTKCQHRRPKQSSQQEYSITPRTLPEHHICLST